MPSVHISKVQAAAFAAASSEEAGAEPLDSPAGFLEDFKENAEIAEQSLASGCEALGIPFVAKWGPYPGEEDSRQIPVELKNQLWGQRWEHGLKVSFKDQQCLVVGLSTGHKSSDIAERLLSNALFSSKLGEIIPDGCDFFELYLVPANAIDFDQK